MYYYENVAESKDDPKRAEEIKANKEKLSQIIDKIEEDVRCEPVPSTLLIALC